MGFLQHSRALPLDTPPPLCYTISTDYTAGALSLYKLSVPLIVSRPCIGSCARPRELIRLAYCVLCSPRSAHTAIAYRLQPSASRCTSHRGATRAASAAQARSPQPRRVARAWADGAQCSPCSPPLAWYLLPAPCSWTLTYIGRRSGSTWGSRMFLAAADGHCQARGQPVVAF